MRIKQSIEAAEEDSKSPGKDKSKQRSDFENESSSGGSGSRGASAAGRRAAGEEELDGWKPVGKSWKVL